MSIGLPVYFEISLSDSQAQGREARLASIAETVGVCDINVEAQAAVERDSQ